MTCALLELGREYSLHIENDGPCEARHVRVTIDDQPLSEHPCVLNGMDEIPVIGPGAYFDVLMSVSFGAPAPPYVVCIAWEDGSGVKDPPFRTTVN